MPGSTNSACLAALLHCELNQAPTSSELSLAALMHLDLNQLPSMSSLPPMRSHPSPPLPISSQGRIELRQLLCSDLNDLPRRPSQSLSSSSPVSSLVPSLQSDLNQLPTCSPSALASTSTRHLPSNLSQIPEAGQSEGKSSWDDGEDKQPSGVTVALILIASKNYLTIYRYLHPRSSGTIMV